MHGSPASRKLPKRHGRKIDPSTKVVGGNGITPSGPRPPLTPEVGDGKRVKPTHTAIGKAPLLGGGLGAGAPRLRSRVIKPTRNAPDNH